MSLSIVKTGKKVKIIAVANGHQFKSKLIAMGLIPGTEIEVIKNSFYGPFIVEVRGSRIMLGRSMAKKIKVK